MFSKECFVAEKIIELRQDEAFITLGILLKIAKLISTGGEAKIFLAENVVLVNDKPDNRRGRKLYQGDRIKIGKDTFLIK